MVFYPDVYNEIPTVDLLSWLFDDSVVDADKNVSETTNDLQKSLCSTYHELMQIFINAADNEQQLKTHQVLSIIRKLVAGLNAVGLKAGDAVCLHAFNHVSEDIFYKTNLPTPM